MDEIMLTEIKISNFKSFNDVTINLNDFNVLIGANGSGKSNFINIFKFLNDIVNKGLDDAISIQGGIKYLKNLNNDWNVPLTIEIKSKERLMFPLTKNGVLYHVEFSDLDYSIHLKFKENLENYEIINEKVSLKGIFYKSNIKPRKGFISSDEVIMGKSGELYDIEFIMSKLRGNMNA
jgi:predicted ATPase